MKIDIFESQFLKSNMYILIEGMQAVFIDPCESYRLPYDIKVDYIFITHEHYDHISGVNYWKQQTDAKVICSNICGENIKDSKKNLSRYFDVFRKLQTWIKTEENNFVAPYECRADITYEGRMSIAWKGHDISLFESPGHSKGSSCIMIDHRYLFSGDSLMKDYQTSCRLPGGSLKDWKRKSEPLFRKLPYGLTVMPGHFDRFSFDEYRNNIGEQG